MNAIDDTIRNLKYTIPEEILEIAFLEYADVNHRMISLDERIKATIILGRVIRDCSRTEGVQVMIDVNRCIVNQLERGEYLIKVPKELTEGRSIVDVLSLTSNVYYTNIGGLTPNGNSILTYSNKMYSNTASANFQQTARMELVGDNLIYVYDPTILVNRTVIRANVEYDDNLTNMHPTVFPVFNRLVELATMSYIHNKLKINLDKGYIYAGYDLSVIREIVDSYSDAEQMYKEYLTTRFAPGAFSTQKEKMARYVKAMLGNNF